MVFVYFQSLSNTRAGERNTEKIKSEGKGESLVLKERKLYFVLFCDELCCCLRCFLFFVVVVVVVVVVVEHKMIQEGERERGRERVL